MIDSPLSVHNVPDHAGLPARGSGQQERRRKKPSGSQGASAHAAGENPANTVAQVSLPSTNPVEKAQGAADDLIGRQVDVVA